MEQIKRKNRSIDMLHGPIFKGIVLFAIPILISSIFQQFYNTMDTFIVGKFLGDHSLAAIGSVNQRLCVRHWEWSCDCNGKSLWEPRREALKEECGRSDCDWHSLFYWYYAYCPAWH